MRRLINGLLAMFGLVTARRYAGLTQQLEQAKKAAHEWKTSYSQATARTGLLEAEVRRLKQNIEKSEKYLAKSRQRPEVDSLRTRLVTAERELLVAREHLMSIEVKLDILEGAANVLDIRTRAAIAKPSSQPSVTA